MQSPLTFPSPKDHCPPTTKNRQLSENNAKTTANVVLWFCVVWWRPHEHANTAPQKSTSPPHIQKQKPHACQMFRVKGRRCMLHSATVVGSVWRDSGHHGVTLLLRIQEPQNTLSKKTNSARQTSSHTARWFATQWVTLP